MSFVLVIDHGTTSSRAIVFRGDICHRDVAHTMTQRAAEGVRHSAPSRGRGTAGKPKTGAGISGDFSLFTLVHGVTFCYLAQYG